MNAMQEAFKKERERQQMLPGTWTRSDQLFFEAGWKGGASFEREECAKAAENFDFNQRAEIDQPRTLPRYVAKAIRERK